MRQNREACDRCHSLKNRCVRDQESQICQRCKRLGLSCKYSPPGRTGRPRGSRRPEPKTGENTTDHDGAQNDTITDSTPRNASRTSFNNAPTNFDIPTGQGGFDFMAAQLCSLGQDATSNLPDLFADGIHEPMLPTPDVSIHNFHTDMRQHGQKDFEQPSSSSGTVSYCSPGDILGSSDQSTPLNGLLELQPRLVRLALRFCQKSSTADDIEELYRLTQNLAAIMAQLENDSAWKASGPGPDFGGIQVLLMSSCYFNLIQAYQSLVDALAAQVNQRSSHGNGQATSLELPYPTISVGGLRLSMPTSAAAEVNLHLVAQTIQNLRNTLKKCTERKGSTKEPSHDSTLGIDDEVLHGGQDAMRSMVDQAVEKLRDGEERLLDNLHELVGVTNNRIFNLR